jgi:hypothetical protein
MTCTSQSKQTDQKGEILSNLKVLEDQVKKLTSDGKELDGEQIKFLNSVFVKIIGLRNKIAFLDP